MRVRESLDEGAYFNGLDIFPTIVAAASSMLKKFTKKAKKKEKIPTLPVPAPAPEIAPAIAPKVPRVKEKPALPWGTIVPIGLAVVGAILILPKVLKKG